MKWRNGAAVALLITGSFQMVGYISDVFVLRGIGALCGWAPFPKVFCDMDGYEGFSAKFSLEGEGADGVPFQIAITPEVYQRLGGPYNRRNVHGAILAGGPRLPQPLGLDLMRRALAPGTALWKELGLPSEVRQLNVRVISREGASEGPWIFSVIGGAS